MDIQVDRPAEVRICFELWYAIALIIRINEKSAITDEQFTSYYITEHIVS